MKSDGFNVCACGVGLGWIPVLRGTRFGRQRRLGGRPGPYSQSSDGANSWLEPFCYA
jgi:hypothetical protein